MLQNLNKTPKNPKVSGKNADYMNKKSFKENERNKLYYGNGSITS